jgi:hypothetical protein
LSAIVWEFLPSDEVGGFRSEKRWDGEGKNMCRQFKNETHQPQELTKKGSSGTV